MVDDRLPPIPECCTELLNLRIEYARLEAAEADRDNYRQVADEYRQAADVEALWADELKARVVRLEANVLLGVSIIDWCIGFLSAYDQQTNEWLIRDKLIEARNALASGSEGKKSD